MLRFLFFTLMTVNQFIVNCIELSSIIRAFFLLFVQSPTNDLFRKNCQKQRKILYAHRLIDIRKEDSRAKLRKVKLFEKMVLPGS